VIDVATGEVVDELPGSATIVDFAFTTDGSKLVVTHDDGVVDVWDAAERALLASYRPAQPAVSALATLPGTDRMVVADLTGALSVLDIISGQTVLVLDGVATRSRAIAVSPDGALVAAPQPDGAIGLWSTHSGSRVGVAPGHNGPVTSLVFDVDGTRLYSASEDGTVRSWAVVIDG
jgi:WD40 repeat protein